MLALQHIHKSYGDKVILDDINFAVNSGEVVALIGENGAGKTTLLQIILGYINPESGTVSRHNEVIGYVPQEAKLGSTIIDCFSVLAESWRINYALESVGLSKVPQDVPVASLSGGQKTRLAFASILALDPEPTVLLLDEPTNNLDAEGLERLASFLRSYHGAVVLVSHDRTFINKTATKIVELQDGVVRTYGGDYEFYKNQKAVEHETEIRKYEEFTAEKKRIKHLMITKKQLAATGIRQKKKAPDNDKSQCNWKVENAQRSFSGQAKALETRLDKLDKVERPFLKKQYRVSLDGDVSSAKLILRLSNIGKSYDKQVLKDISFEIRGSERVHVKGTNGSGKTTLLKIAAGLIQPEDGEVNIGSNVNIGYFSQDVGNLDYDLNGFENLQSTNAKSVDVYTEARSLGLAETDLRKRPGDLSRGQQAKLGFAKLLLGSDQMLILDEPTNHLDIPTREAIESALQNYHGAILVASHDEYFLQQIGISRTLLLVRL